MTMDDPDRDEPEQTAPRSRLDRAVAVAGIIRTLTVPAVATFLIIFFFGPISEIASILPDKVKQATKVSAGGFLIEVERAARAQGNPKLAALIGGLSEPALRYLLDASANRTGLLSYNDDRSIYYRPDGAILKAMGELEQKKLLDCDVPLREWEAAFDRAMQPAVGDGARSYRIREGSGVSARERPLSASCGLTDTGKSAVDLIVEAVSREISQSAEEARDKNGEGN